MKKFRALIIDDERLARVTLMDMLADFPEIEIVGEAESIEESAGLIIRLKPDVLFLDIQLTDGTGFDLLNQITFTGSVIFTTAFDDYAIHAFEINALHYLMKPISLKKLSESIARLQVQTINREVNYTDSYDHNDRIMVTSGNTFRFIRICDIAIVFAANEYTVIRTFDGSEFVDDKTMTDWESRLPGKYFLRINRSAIINFDAIVKTEKRSLNLSLVYLKNYKEPIRISRLYYQKIRKKFQ